MGLDDAYKKAVEFMTQVDPRIAASASGVEYEDDEFKIPLFNRTYAVQFPKGETVEVGAGARVPKMIEVLLMHYLTHADGTAVSGRWISYRQLPGAKLFEQKFLNLVSQPMIELFDSNIDSFREAANGLGGQAIDRKGDAAFWFKALPKLPIACIFNIGEEEIPPFVNILFDESAPHYLPTEDLTILGGIMSSFMKKVVKTDYRKM
jgi:hypothetical protein